MSDPQVTEKQIRSDVSQKGDFNSPNLSKSEAEIKSASQMRTDPDKEVEQASPVKGPLSEEHQKEPNTVQPTQLSGAIEDDAMLQQMQKKGKTPKHSSTYVSQGTRKMQNILKAENPITSMGQAAERLITDQRIGQQQRLSTPAGNKQALSNFGQALSPSGQKEKPPQQQESKYPVISMPTKLFKSPSDSSNETPNEPKRGTAERLLSEQKSSERPSSSAPADQPMGKGELLLQAIGDWRYLEIKFQNNKEYNYPSDFLRGEIQVDKWNNIPYPVVDATEKFHGAFKNTSNIIRELIRENKRKSEFIVKKFKKLESGVSEGAAGLKRMLEINRKTVNDHLEKMQKKNDQSIEMQETILQRLRQEIQNDREFLYSRLMEIDDSKVIRKYIDKQMEEIKLTIEEKVKVQRVEIEEEISKVWKDNLHVDGLVGPEQCRYSSLGNFIRDVLNMGHKLTDEQKILTGQLVADLVKKTQEYMESKFKDFSFTLQRNARIAKQDDDKQEYERDKKMQEIREEFDLKLEGIEKIIQNKQEQSAEQLHQESHLITANLELRIQKVMAEIEAIQHNTDHKFENINSQTDEKFKNNELELNYKIADLERKSQAYAQSQISKKLKESEAAAHSHRKRRKQSANSQNQPGGAFSFGSGSAHSRRLMLSKHKTMIGGHDTGGLNSQPNLSSEEHSRSRGRGSSPATNHHANSSKDVTGLIGSRQSSKKAIVRSYTKDEAYKFKLYGSNKKLQEEYDSESELRDKSGMLMKTVQEEHTESKQNTTMNNYSLEKSVDIGGNDTSRQNDDRAKKRRSKIEIQQNNTTSNDLQSSCLKTPEAIRGTTDPSASLLDASKVNVDLSFPKGESLAIVPEGRAPVRQISEKNPVRKNKQKVPQKTMTNNAVSKSSYKALASPDKLTRSAELREDELSDDAVTPTDQILDDSLSLKGTPTLINETGESHSKRKMSVADKKRMRGSRQMSKESLMINQEYIEKLLTEKVAKAVDDYMKTSHRKPWLAQNSKSPPANIKDYINKQFEKKFGSSVYGYKLPQFANQSPINLVKKSSRLTQGDKRTFVEQLRQQNHAKFNELYAIKGLTQDQVMSESSGPIRNTIMGLLFDQKQTHRQMGTADFNNQKSKSQMRQNVQGVTQAEIKRSGTAGADKQMPKIAFQYSQEILSAAKDNLAEQQLNEYQMMIQDLGSGMSKPTAGSSHLHLLQMQERTNPSRTSKLLLDHANTGDVASKEGDQNELAGGGSREDPLTTKSQKSTMSKARRQIQDAMNTQRLSYNGSNPNLKSIKSPNSQMGSITLQQQKLLNPQNYQILNNFGFAEPIASSSVSIPAGQKVTATSPDMKENKHVGSTPNLVSGSSIPVIKPGEDAQINNYQSIFNMHETSSLKVLSDEGPGAPQGLDTLNKQGISNVQQTHRIPELVGMSLKSAAGASMSDTLPFVEANEQPAAPKAGEGSSVVGFENDMGLTCKPTGVKTGHIPGVAGGLLASVSNQEQQARMLSSYQHEAALSQGSNFFSGQKDSISKFGRNDIASSVNQLRQTQQARASLSQTARGAASSKNGGKSSKATMRQDKAPVQIQENTYRSAQQQPPKHKSVASKKGKGGGKSKLSSSHAAGTQSAVLASRGNDKSTGAIGVKFEGLTAQFQI